MNILDKELYNKVKQKADKIYNKSSAYKSGYIVKEYKKLGGKYSDNFPTNKGLDRWFKENWTDIGNLSYPVYRPTKKITKDTPLLVTEINKKNLQEQIKLKQKIKGKNNLPPFMI
jgi:hypothetical protein